MGEKKTANDNEFNVKEMDTINVLNLYKDGSDFQEKSNYGDIVWACDYPTDEDSCENY